MNDKTKMRRTREKKTQKRSGKRKLIPNPNNSEDDDDDTMDTRPVGRLLLIFYFFASVLTCLLFAINNHFRHFISVWMLIHFSFVHSCMAVCVLMDVFVYYTFLIPVPIPRIPYIANKRLTYIFIQWENRHNIDTYVIIHRYIIGINIAAMYL